MKVKAALARRHPGWLWPAASTIGELFAREGLTARRKRRRRTPPGGPLFAADAPNDVWAMDFKGWFRTGDGARCDTLTLADACSRYLLRCQAVAHPDTEHVWPILDAAFREYGLPLRLRSDNGTPFATTGAGGLSRLSVMAPFMPAPSKVGRPRTTDLREVWNAIQYRAATGCQWALLPEDFPPFTTVQHDSTGCATAACSHVINETAGRWRRA